MSDRGRSPDRGERARSRSRSPARGGDGHADEKRGGGGGWGKKKGVAVRWNNDRGFGFIKPDNDGEDLFCHFSSIIDGNALNEGGAVEYEAGIDDRSGKSRAENVTGGITRDRDQGGGGFGGGGGGGGGGGSQVCFDFQKGRCTRGSSCRFAHEGGGGGGSKL